MIKALALDFDQTLVGGFASLESLTSTLQMLCEHYTRLAAAPSAAAEAGTSAAVAGARGHHASGDPTALAADDAAAAAAPAPAPGT
jgi:hypothetical protein